MIHAAIFATMSLACVLAYLLGRVHGADDARELDALAEAWGDVPHIPGS